MAVPKSQIRKSSVKGTDELPEHLRHLLPMQAAFVKAYVKAGVGAKAARMAGYAEKSAYITSSRLLKDERIQAAIAAERIATSGSNWSDEEVLRGLREQATATGPGSSHAARVAALRAYGEALGLFKRPDLDALAGLQRIEIVLRLPDGSTVPVGGSALLKSGDDAA